MLLPTSKSFKHIMICSGPFEFLQLLWLLLKSSEFQRGPTEKNLFGINWNLLVNVINNLKVSNKGLQRFQQMSVLFL